MKTLVERIAAWLTLLALYIASHEGWLALAEVVIDAIVVGVALLTALIAVQLYQRKPQP